MPKSGILDELASHRGLASLPEAWVELSYGWVAPDEARGRVGDQEPEALAERTARMLTPPTAAESRAYLRVLLDEHFAAPKPARRSIRGIVGVIAMVAAVVLLVMPRLQPTSMPFEAGYGLELSPGLALQREAPADDEVPRYTLDRPITLTLRPPHRVEGAMEVRVFATREDGHTLTLPVEPRSSRKGVVEIQGPPRAWGLDPGRWQLTVVVGPAGGLPDARADVRMGAEAPYDVQQAWIEIVQEAPEER